MGVRSSYIAVACLLALLAVAPSALGADIGTGRAVTASPKGAVKSESRAGAGRPERNAPSSPLIAPAAICPGQSRLDAPATAQERTMICMTEFARRRAGLGPLAANDALAQSAAGKAGDIVGCGEVSHFACGRPFYYWMDEAGYLEENCWWVGENIAWGEGEYGTPGSIFRAWMRSPTHRENILSDFAEIGIAVRTGTLEGRSGVRVWVQHFGAHRCTGSAE